MNMWAYIHLNELFQRNNQYPSTIKKYTNNISNIIKYIYRAAGLGFAGGRCGFLGGGGIIDVWLLQYADKSCYVQQEKDDCFSLRLTKKILSLSQTMAKIPKQEEKLFFEGKYKECLEFVKLSLNNISEYDHNTKQNLTIIGSQC